MNVRSIEGKEKEEGFMSGPSVREIESKFNFWSGNFDLSGADDRLEILYHPSTKPSINETVNIFLISFIDVSFILCFVGVAGDFLLIVPLRAYQKNKCKLTINHYFSFFSWIVNYIGFSTKGTGKWLISVRF